MVKAPTLMMWGMQDVALSHRMARPSLDYCADGKLIFFEDASHWVQHDEGALVSRYLLEFLA
jgi:pimeloyl-ACP methyl ester carboxylesterase